MSENHTQNWMRNSSPDYIAKNVVSKLIRIELPGLPHQGKCRDLSQAPSKTEYNRLTQVNAADESRTQGQIDKAVKGFKATDGLRCS